jgi:hypothetical protein
MIMLIATMVINMAKHKTYKLRFQLSKTIALLSFPAKKPGQAAKQPRVCGPLCRAYKKQTAAAHRHRAGYASVATAGDAPKS